jgi:signal transduction histidine kinase
MVGTDSPVKPSYRALFTVLVVRRDPTSPQSGGSVNRIIPPLPSDASAAALYSFTPKLLASVPFCEHPSVLCAGVERVLRGWAANAQASVPRAVWRPYNQLADNLAMILPTLAGALDSASAAVQSELLRLLAEANSLDQSHGDLAVPLLGSELCQEVIAYVESQFHRSLTTRELVSLVMGVDLLMQKGVAALIDDPDARRLATSEADQCLLAFLSHDLNKNLDAVALWLQVLQTLPQARPMAFVPAGEPAGVTKDSILFTVGGIGRLLNAERMCHGDCQAIPAPLNLRSLVKSLVGAFDCLAAERGIQLIFDVPDDANPVTDRVLLTLILEHLIGASVQFAAPGAVHIRAERLWAAGEPAGWTISMIDDGPGIPVEQFDRILNTFQKGTMDGKVGVGFGLAIASRAAALLGGALSAGSHYGVGSLFTLTLPPPPAAKQ